MRNLIRSIDNGFHKSVSGESPLTLAECKGYKAEKNKLTGNSKRTITIDGTEYVVPDDITLLEYAFSAGASAVDLGVVPVSTDDVSILRRHKGTGSTTSAYFGCMPSASSITPRFSFGKYNNSGPKSFGGFNITQVIDVADTAWHTDRIFYENSTYYFQRDDETPISYNPQIQTECTLTAYLFARHGTNGVQVYDAEGTDIALVDWKDVNGNQRMLAMGAKQGNVVGVYDFVSGRFIAPTVGTLTAGAALPTPEHPLGVKSVGEPYISIGGTHYPVPDGYTLLEYLELVGGEYIDTGISPAGKKIGAVIDFQFTDTSRSTGGVFGSNMTDGTDNCQFTIHNFKWRIKLNSYAKYGSTYNTSRHTARCNMPDGTSLDSTVYTTTQYTIASGNTNNVYVGACNYNSVTTISYSLIGKLYSAKVYDDTTLVRVFCPAKNGSNVVGMYDFVTGTFFPNAGIGTFTAGPEATLEYKLTERVSGENLWNFIQDSAHGGYIQNDGTFVPSIGYYHSDLIAVEPNTAYTVKGTWGGVAQYFYIQKLEYDANGNMISETYFDKNMKIESGTFTTAATTKYVRVSGNIPLGNEYMLVKGSTAPTVYIPYSATTITAYIDKPLDKVGTYADTFDFADGGHVEGVFCHIFDGTESFVNGILDDCWTWNTPVESDTTFTDRTVICTRLKSSSTLPERSNRQGYALVGKVTKATSGKSVGKYIGFGLMGDYTTEAALKTQLAAWYSAGEPLVCWCALATPVTTQHTAVPVTPAQGTNYVESTNEVKARGIEAEFRSRTV